MNPQGRLPSSDERERATTRVGLSGTELIASVMRQAEVARADGNPRKAIQIGLQNLERNGLVNAEELRNLSRACDLAMIASAGGKGRLAAIERLRQLHDAMVLKTSSPIAVSVTAAIVQHFGSSEAVAASPSGSRAALQSLGQNPAAGFLGALVIGGVIGGLAGGVPGVIIGIVGGAVGALTDCSGA